MNEKFVKPTTVRSVNLLDDEIDLSEREMNHLLIYNSKTKKWNKSIKVNPDLSEIKKQSALRHLYIHYQDFCSIIDVQMIHV